MLYIFAKDGTLVTKNSVGEQVALPGVIEKCVELRQAGHILAIASNQGGVARGFISLDEADALMKHAADLIGAKWWKFCPHHPGGKGSLGRECDCRKPKPGMLQSIMRHLGFWPVSTIMIGDMESDRDAAAAAGVRFVWADEFFNREEISE
jgi:D-glycero-D-manno-heptose 1,7-bisphosphate phosphatase